MYIVPKPGWPPSIDPESTGNAREVRAVLSYTRKMFEICVSAPNVQFVPPIPLSARYNPFIVTGYVAVSTTRLGLLFKFKVSKALTSPDIDVRTGWSEILMVDVPAAFGSNE